MSHTPPGRTRKKIFHFVREQILAGLPPTVREVQRAFAFRAVETARRHLENLVEEGRLAKEPGRSRGYRLPAGERAPSGLLIPLVGEVQAGALSEAIQDPEGYLPIVSEEGRGELFALRIRGESMRDAGILPGDIAIVRRQPTALSGQIVVALVGDEATVKRIRFRRGRVELHPENKAFSPIIPSPEELSILGIVVEIRRYLGEMILWDRTPA